MRIRMVITLGSGIHARSNTEVALGDLASRLSDEDTGVRVILSAPEAFEGYYRPIAGEVVVVYLGTRAIEALGEAALEGRLARLVEVAGAWAAERVRAEADARSKHPLLTIVETRNDLGDQIAPSVQAAFTPAGVVEVGVVPPPEAGFRRPAEFDAGWLQQADDGGAGDSVSA